MAKCNFVTFIYNILLVILTSISILNFSNKFINDL